MSSPPTLLLDFSAILSTDKHFWQDVSHLGECIIPKSSFEEIQLTSTGKTESATVEASYEITASEFLKFYSRSGWQVSAAMAVHRELEQLPGHGISRKSRLDLAIAQCAYGLAQLRPESLVVLVTNEQNLLKRINLLGVKNLCAATAMSVRQWARTQTPPQAVSQAQAHLKVGDIKPLPSKNKPLPSTSPRSEGGKVFSVNVSRLLVTGIGWMIAIIILLLVWRSMQPQSFQQFWSKTGLPALPKLPFSEPKSTPK